MPSLILGNSDEDTLEPNPQVTDFSGWFSGVLNYAASAYAEMERFLKQVMPDLQDIKKPVSGKDAGHLVIQFSSDKSTATFPSEEHAQNGARRETVPNTLGGARRTLCAFEDLSDGEKCFMICALVVAANARYGPVFCFWDEPDNYLALSEVGHLVLALRKAFQSAGQFIATSHNPQVIRSFSEDNTFVLYRNSHIEPTQVRPLKDVGVHALTRDDLDL
jgi:hypothetical protein